MFRILCGKCGFIDGVMWRTVVEGVNEVAADDYSCLDGLFEDDGRVRSGGQGACEVVDVTGGFVRQEHRGARREDSPWSWWCVDNWHYCCLVRSSWLVVNWLTVRTSLLVHFLHLIWSCIASMRAEWLAVLSSRCCLRTWLAIAKS